MMHFEQGTDRVKLSIPESCYVVGRSVAEIAQDSRFPIFIGYQNPSHEDLMIPNNGTGTRLNCADCNQAGHMHQSLILSKAVNNFNEAVPHFI